MVKKLILAIIVYIYLFNPVFAFIGIGSIKFVFLIALIYMFRHLKIYQYYLKTYLKPTLLCASLIVYVSFILYESGGNAVTVPRMLFTWWVESFVISVFLIECYFSKGQDLKLIPYLLNISFVASLLSLFLFLNPSINDFVLGGIVELPYENNLGIWDRCFGIAEGLTNSYGVLQGIFASLSLLLLDKKHKLYFFYFIIISISVVINARTGIIPILITVIYKFCYSFKNRMYTFPIIVAVFVFCGVILMQYAEKHFEETLKFVTIFFTASYDYFVYGRASDYYLSLDTHLQLPSNIVSIIFGQGITKFGADIKSSDIAYVNQIFTGGLLYLAGLIWIQFLIYRKLIVDSKLNYIPVLLLITAFIINFKGIGFCTSESFSRFGMLLFFVLIHNESSSNLKIAYL